MITLDDARSLLSAAAKPLEPEERPLNEALGCRLSRAPISDIDIPPCTVSAMDGYALRSADVRAEGSLPVSILIPAGSVPGELPPETAARIFTGAPLPKGADTVIPQEDASPTDDGRVILHDVTPATHIRRKGEIVSQGSELTKPGAVTTPAIISLLASCGAATVSVVPRPRLAIIVTGAELVGAEDQPAPGQIRDSNGPLLKTLAASAGLDVRYCRQVKDSTEELKAAICGACEQADLVLTTGGVSVGDFDLVPEAVEALGGTPLFHRVKMKPGKPLFSARAGATWIMGLPGNPLAVLTGWRLFAWPLAAALAGFSTAFEEKPLSVELAAPLCVKGGRPQLRPAKLHRGNYRPRAEILDWKGSHDIACASLADGLVRLEPGAVYPAGGSVPYFHLPTGSFRPAEFGWGGTP